MEKQYYETVDASKELPDHDSQYKSLSVTVIVIDDKGNSGNGYYDFMNEAWDCSRFSPTHWLRPVNLSDIIREAAGKAFDAGREFEYAAEFGPIPNPYPDKETYLNNL